MALADSSEPLSDREPESLAVGVAFARRAPARQRSSTMRGSRSGRRQFDIRSCRRQCSSCRDVACPRRNRAQFLRRARCLRPHRPCRQWLRSRSVHRPSAWSHRRRPTDRRSLRARRHPRDRSPRHRARRRNPRRCRTDSVRSRRSTCTSGCRSSRRQRRRTGSNPCCQDWSHNFRCRCRWVRRRSRPRCTPHFRTAWTDPGSDKPSRPYRCTLRRRGPRPHRVAARASTAGIECLMPPNGEVTCTSPSR
jgi:hypothetical protein